MTNNILLIEDDTTMNELIVDYLKDFGLNCIAFVNPIDALEELKRNTNYDIVVLDLMLPDLNGFDVFRKIKSIIDIPIIISSARGDIGNKIHGYELGADDFLAKPYEPRELVLRINYILKKSTQETFTIGDFEINTKSREVSVDNYPIDFTKVEFEIFMFLVNNSNRIASREDIIENTSLEPNTKNRTVDMHISNIRYKIGDDSKEPKYIKSVWGVGYKLIS
ncbi:response regulator transcription factor [Arcobacter arenosus]|uniref:response regulator transcription factor n=1 Tax=Arcobacter arenosus TaxID=2576037 RepID=UPI003BA853DA